MTLRFTKELQTAEFESPFNNFKKVQMVGEVRQCPITGYVSRLVPFRFKPLEEPDLTPLLKKSISLGCPFCPDAIPRKTTRFIEDFGVDEGRITKGEAVVFPNAFPYDKYSAVTVISRAHYVPPASFDPKRLLDAFLASQAYFVKIKEFESKVVYAYVNWNYMPQAGAGLVHPHFQLLVPSRPTHYHSRLIESAERYYQIHKESIFEALLEDEKKEGHRYVGNSGDWEWLSAFAPRGNYEFWGILLDDLSVLDMEPRHLEELSVGINRILRFFEEKNIHSYNMALYTYLEPFSPGYRHLVSLVPRMNLPPTGISDINYFDRLHGESLSFIPPEEAAEDLRRFFK